MNDSVSVAFKDGLCVDVGVGQAARTIVLSGIIGVVSSMLVVIGSINGGFHELPVSADQDLRVY